MVFRSARGRGAAVTTFLRAAFIAVALASPAAHAGPGDVLDTPAQLSSLAEKSLLQSVARSGERLIAVGQRGHVLVSNDAGTTWVQSKVPVSSDLTSVFLADALHGWAVGHDGVILATADGGVTWKTQLNGLDAAERIAASANPEARRYKEQGADKPFLDVWFEDARSGFAVGAYNLLFHTSDGGATWESWFDRAENPKLLNLYGIRPAAGELFIAGEGGLVLKLDRAAQRFRAVPTPYAGSFFGVADGGATAVLFGLRGNVYTTGDAGRSWTRVDARLAGSVVASLRAKDGKLLLADTAGRISSSADGGRTFERFALNRTAPLAAFADTGDGHYVIVGPRGLTLAAPR